MLESKRRAVIFFLLSFLLAMAAGFLVLQKVKALNTDLGTVMQIYVAKTDIPSRTIIKPDMVETSEIPKKYLTDYYITDVKEMVGKVAVVPLSEGDAISRNVLKGATVVVNESNRLISMMASERVTFDEPLEALDRVDIVVSDSFSTKPETRLFMKDVKVARVAKKGATFQGIQVEIPLDKAPELIHMQNYADSVRIIKSNVGKETKTELEPVKGSESSEKDQPKGTPKVDPKATEASQAKPAVTKPAKDAKTAVPKKK